MANPQAPEGFVSVELLNIERAVSDDLRERLRASTRASSSHEALRTALGIERASLEEIARIIDPNFAFWEFSVPNSYQQKRKDRALAKATAIRALSDTERSK